MTEATNLQIATKIILQICKQADEDSIATIFLPA